MTNTPVTQNLLTPRFMSELPSQDTNPVRFKVKFKVNCCYVRRELEGQNQTPETRQGCKKKCAQEHVDCRRQWARKLKRIRRTSRVNKNSRDAFSWNCYLNSPC